MKKAIQITLSYIFICHLSFSQTWQLLPNSPSAGFRHDDLFFINKDTGWVANVDGYIYKTIDGGNSFTTQLFQPETSFRCIGFANALKGWAGNLGSGAWSPTTDTIPLYQTADGGNTWQPVTNISGPMPKGICGINVVNDSIVYAVGRVSGPCYIMKTIDGGASWASVNFNPPAFYLIDCKFFSPDTGVVVGCTGSSFNNEKIAIWKTSDGGQNWQLAYNDSSFFFGHCWKVNFPSRNIGYASVETSCFCDTVPVIKTIDGGLTWQNKTWITNFNSINAYEQGIGFINDSTGWCGSDINQVRETNDGGDTWNLFPFVANFNRFRKVNDSIAYASGSRIWKYTNQPVAIVQIEIPQGFLLEQNSPNPFTGKTSIKYNLPFNGLVVLRIYDSAGRPVKTLVNAKQNKGEHQVELALPYYYDTYFYYTLQVENNIVTKRAMMIRNK